MKQSLYTYHAVNMVIDSYLSKGGQVIEFYGSLCDNYILYGNGLKTAVIREVYLNMSSSANSIRLYNETPAKYQRIIDAYENGDDEKARALFFA